MVINEENLRIYKPNESRDSWNLREFLTNVNNSNECDKPER